MKTLAHYLGEYLSQEIDERLQEATFDVDEDALAVMVSEGIDAYESTCNCTISIAGGDCPDCGVPMVKGEATLYTCTDEIETGKYECPKCGYTVYG